MLSEPRWTVEPVQPLRSAVDVRGVIAALRWHLERLRPGHPAGSWRHRVSAGCVAATVLASWTALYVYGLRPVHVEFEPLDGLPASVTPCRNIPIRVDGEFWSTTHGAVPNDLDRYVLDFDREGKTGTLTLTARDDPADVVVLRYHQSDFATLGCVMS